MTGLLDLPHELFGMICSKLIENSSDTESGRAENRKALLPLSKTNHRLWQIARPLLYHDLEIDLWTNPLRPTFLAPHHLTTPFAPYHLTWSTSLLCRTLYEDPLLASSARRLDVRGLVPESPYQGDKGQME